MLVFIAVLRLNYILFVVKIKKGFELLFLHLTPAPSSALQSCLELNLQSWSLSSVPLHTTLSMVKFIGTLPNVNP